MPIADCCPIDFDLKGGESVGDALSVDFPKALICSARSFDGDLIFRNIPEFLSKFESDWIRLLKNKILDNF